jgi:hypothetical protein
MQTHQNAALTVRQREQIQQAVCAGSASYRALATRYGVNLCTIQRWAKRATGQLRRLGRPVGSGSPAALDYEAAVLVERIRQPGHGPVRIAPDLRPRFPRAHRGTVLALLQAHGLTRGTRPQKENALPAPASGPPPRANGRAVPAQTAPGPGLCL